MSRGFVAVSLPDEEGACIGSDPNAAHPSRNEVVSSTDQNTDSEK